GLPAVALRYFNVFGPRQDPGSAYAAVIPLFIKGLLSEERATIYGDGRQTRDFTYVANVVQANLKACSAPVAACGHASNVACGRTVSVIDLYRRIAAKLGREIEPQFAPERKGDVRDSLADIGLARRLLGYQPTHGLDEGLDEAIPWYQENLAA